MRAPGIDLDVDGAADDGSTLTYESSHHNWADIIEAQQGAMTARVLIKYNLGNEGDDGWDLEVTIDESETFVLPVVGSR